MKCRWCSKRAVIKIRGYGIALCEEHLPQFVQRRVKEALKRYKMLGDEESILVAVSGGKDSMVLWDIICSLGYKAEALFIDLGINKGVHSKKAREVVEGFASDKAYKLHVYELKESEGFTIDDVKRKETRTVCAACGLVKRYVMNRFAYENGFSCIATGHNLNDETATLLSNVLSWKTGYLARQAPVLPAKGKLVKKIKPLCEISERETAAYAIIKGIPFFEEECPYSKGATSIVYKRALNLIEYHSPGTKLRFYREFLKKSALFSESVGEELVPCDRCGYPTTHPPCAFCRLKERMLK